MNTLPRRVGASYWRRTPVVLAALQRTAEMEYKYRTEARETVTPEFLSPKTRHEFARCFPYFGTKTTSRDGRERKRREVAESETRLTQGSTSTDK